MVDLSVSRKQIDEIDRQIVELFEKRMDVAERVARYKQETGKPVFDKEREEEKLTKLCAMSHGEFNGRAVKELFGQIMSISRKYQYSLLPSGGLEHGFTRVDKMTGKRDAVVYYYGIPGTHTQQAMEDVFGRDVNGVSCQSFQGIMDAVEKGEADYGILPIENSSTGGITANYDLLLNYDNAILGEYVMKIDQCLLALPGADLSDIRTVFSHPQGFLQSRGFMAKHPEFEGVEYGSTAASAKKVAQDMDKSQAAIASRRAAKEYGLAILADSIQQEKNNCTRFIIIGREKEYASDSNKLALCMELPHVSGSLYQILSHFLYNDLNMTQIESRPIPGRNWEYRFFVDIEGNLGNPSVRNALRGVSEEAAFLRVLGNFKVTYPLERMI